MIGWRGIPLIGLVLAAWPAAGQDLQAMKQFGTSGTDRAFGVAVDATGAYVAGTTTGSFPGFSNQGSTDAFIRKLDKNGSEIWTRQMGTSSREEVWAVAVDATGVYVAGATSGSMSGNTSQGAQDAFITKFDLNGLELWTRQFGSFGNDKVLGMAAADGALYVCGSASDALPSQSAFGQSDAFVRKYTTGGLELWTRQLGTSAIDEAWGVAADGTGVFVAGYTYGTLPGLATAGGADSFVLRFDENGLEQWRRQFGTAADDLALDVALGDAIYVLGMTAGAFPGTSSAGSTDLFVRKMSVSGSDLWTRQFGSSASDSPWGISAGAGGAAVAGTTTGSLPGLTNAGAADAFVRYYDSAGGDRFTVAIATAASDEGLSVAIEADAVNIAGATSGVLPGQSGSGSADAFFARLRVPTVEPPPPSGPPTPPAHTATAQALLEDLARKVAALATPSGPLTKGQVQSLLVKLEHALRALQSDRSNVVCNLLGAFVNETGALARSGNLTADQAESLLAIAASIGQQRGCLAE